MEDLWKHDFCEFVPMEDVQYIERAYSDLVESLVRIEAMWKASFCRKPSQGQIIKPF
jgi:hypothetical protein